MEEKSRRQEQLGVLYQKIASEFFQEHISLEEIVASVTRVEVKDGLREIVIYYSVWPDAKEKPVARRLMELKGALRDQVGQETNTKFVPDIRFRLDESEKRRMGIERLLKKARE